MRVLVTGAAGQFGRQIVPALQADPRVTRVVATDCVPAEGLVQLDLADAVALLDEVDAVIHLAFRVDRLPGEDLTHSNVDAQQRFLGAALARDLQLVVASSVAAYGLRDAPGRLTEDTPFAPPGAFYYARQKQAAEQLLAAGGKARVVVVRPSMVAGPHTDPRRVLQYKGRVALTAATRFPPRVQLLHEADLGPAFLALLFAPPGAYNLAPDDDLDEAEAARAAGQTLLKVPRWLYRAACDLTWRLGLNALDASWLETRDHAFPVADNAKLRALGWHPAHTTRETLLATVAALRGQEDPR